MTFELPADLQPTAEILRRSLMLRADEKAPAIPAGLFDDLASRFATSFGVSAPLPKVSPLGKIRHYVSTPAFGLSAAALVILAFVLPLADGPDGTGFRGGSPDIGAGATSSIVLIGGPQDIVSSLSNSGDFEKGSILTSDTAPGAKVIVDFNAATITAINADGEPVHTAPLPAGEADLSAAIAEALGKL